MTSSEVAELLKISQHKLRYWVKRFPFLCPQKNEAGLLEFSMRDIQIAMRIQYLNEQEHLSPKKCGKVIVNELANETDFQLLYSINKVRADIIKLKQRGKK